MCWNVVWSVIQLWHFDCTIIEIHLWTAGRYSNSSSIPWINENIGYFHLKFCCSTCSASIWQFNFKLKVFKANQWFNPLIPQSNPLRWRMKSAQMEMAELVLGQTTFKHAESTRSDSCMKANESFKFKWIARVSCKTKYPHNVRKCSKSFLLKLKSKFFLKLYRYFELGWHAIMINCHEVKKICAKSLPLFKGHPFDVRDRKGFLVMSLETKQIRRKSVRPN